MADQDHKGCFLFNTALQINTHDEEVNTIVTNGIRERGVSPAQYRGGPGSRKDPERTGPEDTAKALLALIVAIGVLGRGVFTEASLRTIADQGKRLVGA